MPIFFIPDLVEGDSYMKIFSYYKNWHFQEFPVRFNMNYMCLTIICNNMLRMCSHFFQD